MNEKELKLILKEGEGYKVEFKENITGVDKDIVAFSNSSGGRIFIGITDEGKIKGIKITNRLKSEIQNIASNCEPPIKLKFKSFENILIIEIEEGKDKPYKCSLGFYKRIGPISQKLKRNEILDFFKTEGKIRFDELINEKFKFPQDFSKEKLNKFLKLAGLSKSIPLKEVLVNLGVAEIKRGKIYFNNAGVLFFAKEPQHPKLIPWSVFTVVLFKDKEGVDVIDRKEITGSLFEIVEQVIDFVKLYTKVAYKFTGSPQREEIYEYPLEAIREAVINSVMHKDYFEHGHSNILKFFPNRIQIENIWKKPAHFILGKTVFRRNQIIADLFSRIHFGEKLGSGMQRMKDICKKENAPYPEIEYTPTHFYITFKPSFKYLKIVKEAEKETKERLVERLVEGLVENQRKILEWVKINPYISKKELANKIGISTTAVDKNIIKLKKKGLLKRVGPDRGGRWEVIGGR